MGEKDGSVCVCMCVRESVTDRGRERSGERGGGEREGGGREGGRGGCSACDDSTSLG